MDTATEEGYALLGSSYGEPPRLWRVAWKVLACLSILMLVLFQLPSLAKQAGMTADLVGEGPPAATTGCGRLEGRWEATLAGSVAAFRGIQFGRAARWMPPSLSCPSSETAAADGPSCFQHDASQRHAGQSEECLYLNLFSPACAAEGWCEKLPVIVFLHGGGLQGGDASGYNGIQQLVALSGDTILVICQYRLGVLGFMATPELSRRDSRGVSGNYGFLDQQLCLRWVSEHAASFGGDPGAVTLLGHSAGATTINGHLAAPGSAGFFQRAILLSGSPGTPKLSQAEKEFQDASLWLPGTGCTAGSLDCLLKLDAGILADSLPQAYRRGVTNSHD